MFSSADNEVVPSSTVPLIVGVPTSTKILLLVELSLVSLLILYMLGNVTLALTVPSTVIVLPPSCIVTVPLTGCVACQNVPVTAILPLDSLTNTPSVVLPRIRSQVLPLNTMLWLSVGNTTVGDASPSLTAESNVSSLVPSHSLTLSTITSPSRLIPST